jgi:uncharacterized protein (DUF736 family)
MVQLQNIKGERFMNIGKFTKSGDGYKGNIKTLTISVEATLEPITNRASDKTPDFRITSGGAEIGAAWKKTAEESGKEYLSLHLDDVSFPSKIYASLFLQADGSYNLVWERSK